MANWWRPGLTGRSALLLPLSWLFGALVALRRALYRHQILRSTRLPVPVVVVGNLTVGGSGKTPLVIALIGALRAAGYRPGVISRGYGGNHRGRSSPPLEVAFDADPVECGDEPLLIRRRTQAPVFVCRDRPRAADALLAAHPEVNLLLSDDGLQHYALARDIEIAVFDARGAGNRQLLPAGPLREPLSRAASLTAIVYNDTDEKITETGSHQGFPAEFQMSLAAQPSYQLINPAETCAVAALGERAQHSANDTLAAVAGIGDPARFFATLRAAGLTFIEHPFPDHHAFTRADLAAVRADAIVMTEKDALKCSAFNDARIWVLPVEAQIDPALVNLIVEKLRGRQAA